jgi:hypothetical protein
VYVYLAKNPTHPSSKRKKIDISKDPLLAPQPTLQNSKLKRQR